jgi:hypothetical protein
MTFADDERSARKALHEELERYFYPIKNSMKQKYIHKRYYLGIESPMKIPVLRRTYDLIQQKWCDF